MNEMEQAERAPKKKNLLLRLLIFLITLALVLGAAALVVFRDRLTLDALRRWVTYRSVAKSSTGLAEPFTHGGGEQLALACLERGYLISSTAGARCYALDGTELSARVAPMEKPVLSAGLRSAAVFDGGGQDVWQFSTSGDPFVYESDGVLSARVNAGGWMAVTEQKSHYRSSVTVLDAGHQPVMALNYSSAFAADAVLSPDAKAVAVVTVGQKEGAFLSTLLIYPTDRDEPIAELELGSLAVLDLDFDSAGIWLVCDTALVTVSADGARRCDFIYDPAFLKGCSLGGDGFAVLLLGQYRAGSARDAVTVGPDAQELARRTLKYQILSLSASGRYLALLSGHDLEVCTADLSPCSTLEDIRGARSACVCADGSALLADSQEAWLYVPG